MEKIKVSELKKLPVRKWDEEKVYNSILVFKEGAKHDSGYSIIQVVGVMENGEMETACFCDDILWDVTGVKSKYSFRNDMYYPSGVLRFWSREHKYKVGASLSSTEIKIVDR